MLTASLRPALVLPVLALALTLAAGCGGHGTATGPGTNSFRVLTVSVPNNGIWQINRPIQFGFNQPVDFSSVNLNTILISQPNGTPAAGEFSLVSPTTVEFQPACPTLPDFSDAGLLPNGVAYRINVLATSQGGPTVLSSSGRPLSSGQTVNFTTPLSALLDPTILFLDPQLGPPVAVVRARPAGGDCDESLDKSYVEVGGDSSIAARRFFIARSTPEPELGAEVDGLDAVGPCAPASSFKGPLNLYSEPASGLAIVLALNQPVDPSASNITPENVDLQYLREDDVWTPVAHTVELTSNCTDTGAKLRVVPTGILPQGRLVRVVVGSNFKDLVGDFNIVPIIIGAFEIDIATDPGTTTPGDQGDVATETFTVSGDAPGSREDQDSVLTIQVGAPPTTTSAPRAVWGEDGKLKASFAFDGTGGPTGAFDWVIDGTVIVDTSFAVITDFTQQLQQTVVNGRIDVRSLWVRPTGVLVLQGTNPCTILCSGSVPGTPGTGVLIQGILQCNGTNNRGVVSFSTSNIPEQGAAGQVGGGNGGTGNFLTTQSTPQGGAGFGPFNTPGGGGQGGESGFNPQANDTLRRPAGGGGGVTGKTQFERARPTCPDQRVIGMDAEQGFPGAPTAIGALHPGPPIGGLPGPSPFIDSDATNDFWGTMVTSTGQVILGELQDPRPGEGGGGGGSACMTTSFPTTPFLPTGDEKGAGGGGGAGALSIFALNDIRLAGLGAAARGRIEVNGGTGGGGENTSGVNRIGGGSGGGSGGHLILQTAAQIDLSRCTSVSTSVSGVVFWGGLFARGGQGGEGQDGQGGAKANGFETTPGVDSLPANSYPNTTAPCGITSGTNDAATTGVYLNNPPQFVFTNAIGIRICAGGDGGPGIIQLHASRLQDIVVPLSAVPPLTPKFRDICFPLPTGATPLNADTPSQWNQMLPIFGRLSVARSKWIPLGAASVAPPPAVTPDLVRFFFAGTNPATGVVQRAGVGTTATVAPLPPILDGALVASPGQPSITSDLRSVVFDAGLLVDDIYKRNPSILKGFALRMTADATDVATTFDVVAATYDSALDEIRVTVGTSGTPLAGYAIGDTAELIPRFFRVSTDGLIDSYPSSANIRIRFQTAPANSLGQPDESALPPFTDDITTLNSTTARFIRFQVEFDIQADTVGPLPANAPIPALEFLSVPFRF